MKNYIVIGATSGIGEVCAKKLSGKDNTLVIVGRNEEKLDWLKNTLSGNIIPVQYDLSDLYNIKEIYNVCKTQSIKLDGMVYSAGVDGTWPIKVNSINKMRKMMDINCFAFVELARKFNNGTGNGVLQCLKSSFECSGKDNGKRIYSKKDTGKCCSSGWSIDSYG